MIWFAFFIACGDNKEDSGQQNTAFDGSTASGSLPNPMDDISFSDCEGYDGVDIPGAERFFYGQFEVDEAGNISGIEQILNYANSSWKALGEDDCISVYMVTGVVTTPVACTSCDIGISIEANLDTNQSTCPDALNEGFESFSTSYDISQSADGKSTWYFTSGNPLGQGYHDDSGLNYLSAGSCVYF